VAFREMVVMEVEGRLGWVEVVIVVMTNCVSVASGPCTARKREASPRVVTLEFRVSKNSNTPGTLKPKYLNAFSGCTKFCGKNTNKQRYFKKTTNKNHEQKQ
jgi:hypothetical protein